MKTPGLLNNVPGFPTRNQSNVCGLGHGPKLSVSHSTVHAAFENIVDTYPAVVAAIHGTSNITYLQLDLAANRLAHHLISSGLRPRQRVCLVVQRSLEMLIGFLAILKAGCQYVPIDGGVASDEALRHIFADTEARFILCLPRYWDRVKHFANQETVILELGMNTGAYYSPTRPGIRVTSDDGVYAMYTSGMLLSISTIACSDYFVRQYGCA
jgi:non-ribosomal peptide synthetase component F